MSEQPALFEAPPAPPVPEAAPVAKVSADVRRRQRQAQALAHGYHPLGVALGAHIRLHPQAAPAGDRAADGARCGTCRWREPGRYPKCFYDRPHRISHGPGTDVAAWWPACTNYESKETRTDD